jgi:hypothetical protein
MVKPLDLRVEAPHRRGRDRIRHGHLDEKRGSRAVEDREVSKPIQVPMAAAVLAVVVVATAAVASDDPAPSAETPQTAAQVEELRELAVQPLVTTTTVAPTTTVPTTTTVAPTTTTVAPTTTTVAPTTTTNSGSFLPKPRMKPSVTDAEFTLDSDGTYQLGSDPEFEEVFIEVWDHNVAFNEMILDLGDPQFREDPRWLVDVEDSEEAISFYAASKSMHDTFAATVDSCDDLDDLGAMYRATAKNDLDDEWITRLLIHSLQWFASPTDYAFISSCWG